MPTRHAVLFFHSLHRYKNDWKPRFPAYCRWAGESETPLPPNVLLRWGLETPLPSYYCWGGVNDLSSIGVPLHADTLLIPERGAST